MPAVAQRPRSAAGRPAHLVGDRAAAMIFISASVYQGSLIRLAVQADAEPGKLTLCFNGFCAFEPIRWLQGSYFSCRQKWQDDRN